MHSTSVHSESLRLLNATGQFILEESEFNISDLYTEHIDSIRIIKSRVTGNNLTLSNSKNSAMRLENSSISISSIICVDNTAESGGCLHLTSSIASIELGSFISNRATKGGAIYHESSQVELLSCEFHSNQAVHGNNYATNPVVLTTDH